MSPRQHTTSPNIFFENTKMTSTCPNNRLTLSSTPSMTDQYSAPPTGHQTFLPYYPILTSACLTATYLSLILTLNITLHAVTQTNPDALAIAHALDEENAAGICRGLLHGVPLLLKDNIVTLDGMDTTCGSLALVGARPEKEANVIGVLRRAGAVILGKGNMAEWAGFRSTSGDSGWSATGGQSTGIYYPGMKASGSSGGCGVAVGAGMAFAALGTETCYSITSSAEKSGIIGFKPTRDLISSQGIIHASKRLDTVGILARTLPDIIRVLLGLIPESTHIPSPMRQKLVHDLSPTCSSMRLDGMRLGIPAFLPPLSACKTQAFTKVLRVLQSAGATIIYNISMPGVQACESLPQAAKNSMLYTEMKSAINTYLSFLVINPQNIHTLSDLIAFTTTHPDEAYPQRNVAGLEAALATDPEDALYKTMLAKEEYWIGEGGITVTLNRHQCDVLILPNLNVTLQTFAAKAGSQVCRVPMGVFPVGTNVEVEKGNGLVGQAPGIPVSAYIFGRATKDEDVLKVGYVVERGLRVREVLVPFFETSTGVELFSGM
ncbi:amidase signature enzyme [Decorospora gaudefroyi]|uniref:Amidase signature enzyme n=1 Tax=Decorospora gaudefroyi TaxID=184978 RepID=A0A6A5K2T9_9PLEO|nr:amidase signature enzyme [Decorospora gaudefroyi]